jgi:glycosyltransferase involved in cell wall biosynthesis
VLAHALRDALVGQGHHTEIVAIPFQWHPPEQLVRSMLVWRMLDLTSYNGRAVDMVVGLKFPAYLVPHPNKVVWLLHQHKQAYRLSGTQYSDLGRTEESRRVRDMVVEADTGLIPEAKRIFAISRTVAERLQRFNGIAAEPLYPPVANARVLRCSGYGNYIFYPSRLDHQKRQELLVRAMALVKTEVRCFLAGTGPDQERLQGLISQLRVESRVKLLGYLTEQELADWYSDALAVYFGPFEEDYGYVTLEAGLSRKAVLTLNDSAGPLEFVKDQINGFVLPPEPDAIAQKIDLLFENRRLAEAIGVRAYELLAEMDLTWNKVVRKLLS